MKNKSIFIALFAAIVLVIFILVLIFTDKAPSEEGVPSTPQGNSSSSIEVDEPETRQFEEILFDTTPSMYGKTDYFSIQIGKDLKEGSMEYLQLEPLVNDDGIPRKYYLGHQIYKSKTSGEEYILSGNFVMAISFNPDTTGNGYVREEETGKRIHMFGNTSDLQNFQDNWDAGQRILSGKTEAPENAIIFDGVLTPYTFERENGTMYFDISELAPYISPEIYYDELMGYIDIYVNDFCTVRIPTTTVNPMMSETYGVVGSNFKFRSWNGEKFTAWGPVLDALHPKISIEDASMMFGWKMYTNGTALSIVTDPLNATPLAAIRENGDLGIRIVLNVEDDGLRYICAYDTDGNLMWKKPFDESALSEEDNSSILQEDITSQSDSNTAGENNGSSAATAESDDDASTDNMPNVG